MRWNLKSAKKKKFNLKKKKKKTVMMDASSSADWRQHASAARIQTLARGWLARRLYGRDVRRARRLGRSSLEVLTTERTYAAGLAAMATAFRREGLSGNIFSEAEADRLVANVPAIQRAHTAFLADLEDVFAVRGRKVRGSGGSSLWTTGSNNRIRHDDDLIKGTRKKKKTEQKKKKKKKKATTAPFSNLKTP
jgi:hypothetical protein